MPVVDFLLAIADFFNADEFPVGEGKKLFGNLHPNFRGGKLAGIVEAREPEPGIFIFPLGPHLHRFVRVMLVGPDEVQSPLRPIDLVGNF